MTSEARREFAIGARLQELLHELNLTQARAAELAGLDRSAINDIIRDNNPQISVRKLKQILDGLGVTMGRFFKEPSLELTESDAALAHDFHGLLARQLATDATLKERRHREPAKGLRQRKRRAPHKVSRGLASGGPRETYPDVHHLPDETIPPDYYKRGARLAYEVDGDSMIGDGIMHGAVLYVRPTVDVAALDGKIAICKLKGSDYVKRIDTRSGQILLHSSNLKYDPIPVDEDADDFRLIGEVIQ